MYGGYLNIQLKYNLNYIKQNYMDSWIIFKRKKKRMILHLKKNKFIKENIPSGKT